jgi:hypothetical protein
MNGEEMARAKMGQIGHSAQRVIDGHDRLFVSDDRVLTARVNPG